MAVPALPVPRRPRAAGGSAVSQAEKFRLTSGGASLFSSTLLRRFSAPFSAALPEAVSPGPSFFARLSISVLLRLSLSGRGSDPQRSLLPVLDWRQEGVSPSASRQFAGKASWA